jgi:hypothetical protein
VAELISNAWDADAKNVWITIPFGQSWSPESQIVVTDDGLGMTRQDAQHAYLVVGRKRRLATGDASPGGRKVHGRKGIGKLAAFGTARFLECTTSRDGTNTAFRLDYDAIRKLPPDQDYPVEAAAVDTLMNPEDHTPLEHGTRIRLTSLWLKRALSKDQFMRSMSRRFAISTTSMRVVINGEQLTRFDMPVEIRFPRDGTPPDVVVGNDGWAEEEVDPGRPVRWWIGFTALPLDDESLQGISVLARGKMAQRPFKFERSQGAEGQLGQEYLVGEVIADWLDEGVDIEDDLIQSNRDQLQLEDQRLDAFLQWGRRRLGWALRTRNRIRAERSIEAFRADTELVTLLADYTTRERDLFLGIANRVSRLPEMTAQGVTGLMRQVLDAQSDRVVRQMMEEIAEEPDPLQDRIWYLVQRFGLIDARRNLSIIEARLQTIAKLKDAVLSGAREVPDIHGIIRKDTWLLDPRWHLLDDELDIASLGLTPEPELDEEGNVLDFLFALAPAAPAPLDVVVVVEIKRGTLPTGKVRKATDDEVHKFHSYVLGVQAHYEKSTRPPAVRGLMIAQDYTARADTLRKNLEGIPSPQLEFRTWELVLEETERLHSGWLSVSLKRAQAELPPFEPTEG